jgi:putative resolvase
MLVMRKIYRINGFARRIGRATSTVRPPEREGKLAARRLPSGQRYLDESDVRAMPGGAPGKRLTVVYCRVSRAGQREDLAAQVAAMVPYCRAGAIAIDEWIQEVGGGMTFRRKRFLSMTERIRRGETERVLMAHQDRPVRFGFDLLDHLSREYGSRAHRGQSGIPVVVNAAYTSQMDSFTGLLEGRRAGDKFYRTNGDVCQADFNAARNVRNRIHDRAITRYMPRLQVKQILHARSSGATGRQEASVGRRKPRQRSADKSTALL